MSAGAHRAARGQAEEAGAPLRELYRHMGAAPVTGPDGDASLESPLPALQAWTLARELAEKAGPGEWGAPAAEALAQLAAALAQVLYPGSFYMHAQRSARGAAAA